MNDEDIAKIITRQIKDHEEYISQRLGVRRLFLLNDEFFLPPVTLPRVPPKTDEDDCLPDLQIQRNRCRMTVRENSACTSLLGKFGSDGIQDVQIGVVTMSVLFRVSK